MFHTLAFLQIDRFSIHFCILFDMTHIIPNKPFIISLSLVLIWLISTAFVVIPVQVSTILLSFCLVYIGSYISIFTKKECICAVFNK